MLVPDHAAMDPALSVHSFAKAEFAMFAYLTLLNRALRPRCINMAGQILHFPHVV